MKKELTPEQYNALVIEVGTELEQVLGVSDVEPFGENMSVSFQIGDQWFTDTMQRHFNARKQMQACGITDPMNIDYVQWALSGCREFVKFGNFIYMV